MNNEAVLYSNQCNISETVEVASGQTVVANKRGDAKVNTTKGEVKLKAALVLPGLRANLISVSKATDEDNTVVF